MSDQLREAFRELADEAPDIDATAASSSRTWRRARHARRRGVMAVSCVVVTMLIGGILVAVGLSGISKPAPVKPPPYDQSKLAIPNQVWLPSEWTPSTEDAGPLGPLALIATAPHRTSWFHTDDNALFGVSAATGNYRFIDLPNADLKQGTGIALSPDGTKIGYLLLGSLATAKSQPNDLGYAVYDTVTGRVTKHLVPTRYGLAPDWLTFTADSTDLVVSYEQWGVDRDATGEGRIGSRNSGGAEYPGHTEAWNPATDEVNPLGPSSYASDVASGANGIALFSPENSRVVTTINPRTGERSRITLAESGEIDPVVSPSGKAIAFGGSREMGSGWRSSSTGETAAADLFLARQPTVPGARWRTTVVVADSLGDYGIYGWLDDSHLLVYRPHPHGIYSLDVPTGQSTLRTRFIGAAHGVIWPNLASDLIARPFVAGDEPVAPRDPRILPGIGLGILALGLVGLLIWPVLRWENRRILRSLDEAG